MLSKLPEKYHWLCALEGVPRVIVEGAALLGVTETVGTLHNKTIMGWAKALKIEKIYTNDELAWCGLAHAYILTRAGKFVPLKGWDLLRALKYKQFGVAVPKNGAMLGDTLIFGRTGGGHVGTYIAESPTTFHVMGGNQSNRFSIVEIAKDRLEAVRRPVYTNTPAAVKKYFMDSSGLVSTNEA